MDTSKSKINNLVFWVLLITPFLSSLFFIPLKFVSIQYGTSLVFAFGVITSVVLFVASSLISREIELPKPTILLLPLIFYILAVTLVSGLANNFLKAAVFGYTFDINSAGFIFLCFAYFYLIIIYFRDSKKIFYSYFAFFISSFVVSIFLTLRLVFGSDFLSFGIFKGLTSTTIGSWNNLGIFFAVETVLAMLTFELAPISKFLKTLLIIIVLSSLFFLALINFYAIWLILSICSFLFMVYLFLVKKNRGLLYEKEFGLPICPTIIFVISTAFVFWGGMLSTQLSNFFGITNLEIRPSFLITTKIIINTVKEKPLFGAGPNGFANGWLKWRPDDVLTTVFWNADFTNGTGLMLTQMATSGILGFLGWATFFAHFLYFGVRSLFKKSEEVFHKYLTASSFFVSLFLWIMSFFYVPSVPIYILTFYFTGLFFASCRTSYSPGSKGETVAGVEALRLPSFLLLGIILGAAVFFGYGLVQNTRSLYYYQKGFDALNLENKTTKSKEYLQKAISLVGYDVYYRALSEVELVRLKEVSAQDVNTVKQEDVQKQFADVLSSAMLAAKSAKNEDPNNYLNWLALGRVYETVSTPSLKIKDAYSNALTSYIEAFKLNPKNPTILVTLSRLAYSQKDLAEARNYAEMAINVKKNYSEAYYTLSQIEAAEGNVPRAIEAVQMSTKIDPTNPAMFFQLGLLKFNQLDWAGSIEALQRATSLVKDYANAKYFLGLSYEAVGQHENAIKEFQDLKQTNPESKEVQAILENLLANKPIFNNNKDNSVKGAKTLPLKER